MAAIGKHRGQFVGPIPSRARLTAKLTGPIDATDAGLLPLAAAGMNTLALNCDLGAAWTEASRTGQTLIIKLTPLGKVPALQLIQVLKTDPLIALAQFRIEASTGL